MRYARRMNEPYDLGALGRRLAGILDPRAEVLEAYLFGSVATGRAQAHSDLDVAVFVDLTVAPSGGFGYRAGLTTDLMAGLGTNEVDVVVLNDAPPLLYHRVLRDGIRVLSRNLKETTVREARAVSRYCDFIPQLAKIDGVLYGTSKREAPAS
ncbi:MAG: nucleotidyltransferase domain-containing protein [Acidobacteria bacterium]|nr:MAG: nucleotidyltransferase domain-containing protein [Acidobacteriota bacterium]